MSQDDEKSNCYVILGFDFRVSIFLGFLLAGIEEDFLVQIPRLHVTWRHSSGIKWKGRSAFWISFWTIGLSKSYRLQFNTQDNSRPTRSRVICEAVGLFNISLESIFRHESMRLGTSENFTMLADEDFHKALYAISVALILKAHSCISITFLIFWSLSKLIRTSLWWFPNHLWQSCRTSCLSSQKGIWSRVKA